MAETFEFTPIQQAWLDALKSGEYAQTTAVLHRTSETYGDNVGFCCLGVACDVMAKTGVLEFERHIDEKEGWETFRTVGTGFTDDTNHELMPTGAWEVLGLRDAAGKAHCDILSDEDAEEYAIQWGYESLTDANDRGAPFEDIAAMLERFPRVFFKTT